MLQFETDSEMRPRSAFPPRSLIRHRPPGHVGRAVARPNPPVAARPSSARSGSYVAAEAAALAHPDLRVMTERERRTRAGRRPASAATPSQLAIASSRGLGTRPSTAAGVLSVSSAHLPAAATTLTTAQTGEVGATTEVIEGHGEAQPSAPAIEEEAYLAYISHRARSRHRPLLPSGIEGHGDEYDWQAADVHPALHAQAYSSR